MPERSRKTPASRAFQLKPVENEVSPDVLMRDFRQQKIVLLVLATILVHAVLIFGSSYGFIRKKLFGAEAVELSKEERVKEALGEATSALGDIAKRHDLKVDDLTERFAGSGSRASRIRESGETGKTQGTATPAKDGEKEPGGKAPDTKEQSKEDAGTEAQGKEEPAKKEPEPKLSELEKSFPKATPGPATPAVDKEDATGLP